MHKKSKFKKLVEIIDNKIVKRAPYFFLFKEEQRTLANRNFFEIMNVKHLIGIGIVYLSIALPLYQIKKDVDELKQKQEVISASNDVMKYTTGSSSLDEVVNQQEPKKEKDLTMDLIPFEKNKDYMIWATNNVDIVKEYLSNNPEGLVFVEALGDDKKDLHYFNIFDRIRKFNNILINGKAYFNRVDNEYFMRKELSKDDKGLNPTYFILEQKNNPRNDANSDSVKKVVESYAR